MLLTTERDLDDALADPRPALVDDLRRVPGDVLVLGAGGKLGPSLVSLLVRARAAGAPDGADQGRVYAVSRFGDAGVADTLEARGATVVRADVTADADLQALPDCPNVVFLVGSKFGTTGAEDETWLTNTYLPGRIVERFAGARIVALSTGNVYPLSAVTTGGCTETDPVGPVGEYAMSCLGRERVMSALAARTGTPLALVRLNYAVEARYGVLVDLAGAIDAGEPVDVTTGAVNVVWQGYANEVVLRCLAHCATPPFVLNLTGPDTLGVRDLATRLGERLGRRPQFRGHEADTALLSDASRCQELFGPADVDVDDLLELTAGWVRHGGRRLGKPTHFATRDGRF